MGTDTKFLQFVVDQLARGGDIAYRKMFGEYAIYCEAKVVALVCDNHLYMKPTEAGRALLGTPVEAPPYPNAKNWFLIGDELDDAEWLGRLVRATADELPVPKPKKAAAKKGAVKKVAAKKVVAKRAVAKKVVANNSVAKKAVAKKVVAKKLAAKKSAATKRPTQKTAAKKTAAKKTRPKAQLAKTPKAA